MFQTESEDEFKSNLSYLVWALCAIVLVWVWTGIRCLCCERCICCRPYRQACDYAVCLVFVGAAGIIAAEVVHYFPGYVSLGVAGIVGWVKYAYKLLCLALF